MKDDEGSKKKETPGFETVKYYINKAYKRKVEDTLNSFAQCSAICILYLLFLVGCCTWQYSFL